MDKIKKDKLFTGDYMCIMAANFLLYFGFFLLLPIIPFYLAETFGADKAVIGVVLSIYTVASLFMRSCSGYLVDTFARKPLYLFAYFTFTAMFFGYIVAFTLTMFAILRFVHGLAFGLVTDIRFRACVLPARIHIGFACEDPAETEGGETGDFSRPLFPA